MILAILLLSACIYCVYNLNQCENMYEKAYDRYFVGAIGCGLCFIFLIFAALCCHTESAFDFEAYKEMKTNLEYQIENPHRRDHNFFEQLSNYNMEIVKNQEYNKDWFLNGICISDKWNDIETLKFSEAN